MKGHCVDEMREAKKQESLADGLCVCVCVFMNNNFAQFILKIFLFICNLWLINVGVLRRGHISHLTLASGQIDLY